MTVSLTDDKADKICAYIHQLKKATTVTIREGAELMGMLVAPFPTVSLHGQVVL